MNKVFITFCLFVAWQHVRASGNTIGNHWRWSKDEGTITSRDSAAWLKPVNVAPVISKPGALRLRILTVTTGGYSFTSQDTLVLEYRVEPQSNSRTSVNAGGTRVNATSSTAGNWIRVPVGSIGAVATAFTIDPDYDDSPANALKDLFGDFTTAGNILYDKTNSTLDPLVSVAQHEDLFGSVVRRGGVGLSKSNKIYSGAVAGLSSLSAGGFEVEYRLVATALANPATTYYFRLRNVISSGGGAGTVDSWDYASGYPSISTSGDYNATVNSALPNIGVTLNVPTPMAFTPATPKAGTLFVSNVSSGIASFGNITGNFTVPSGGWTISLGAGAPLGWNLTGTTLSSSNVIQGGTSVSIPIVITPPGSAIPNGGAVTFTLGNATGNAGGDGTVFNNRGAVAVYKP